MPRPQKAGAWLGCGRQEGGGCPQPPQESRRYRQPRRGYLVIGNKLQPGMRWWRVAASWTYVPAGPSLLLWGLPGLTTREWGASLWS